LSARFIDIIDGARVRGTGGPAVAGDVWNVSQFSRFPIENIFGSYSRSPRETWRSDDETQQTISLAFDPTLLATAESNVQRTTWGLHLNNINFRTAALYYYDVDTVAWVLVGNIDTATGHSAVAYTRKGNTLIPNADTTTWFSRQKLTGWTAVLGADIREVLGNESGLWSNTTTTTRSSIVLDDITGGEAASGNVALWSTTCTVLFRLGTVPQNAAGFRLVIGAQTTKDGYFKIGSMVLGPVHMFGLPYSHGRLVRTEPGWQFDDMADHSRTLAKFGPPRRVVEFGWKDIIDTTDVYDTATEPNYIRSTATAGPLADAAIPETPNDLVGTIRQLEGHPLVYLPVIVKGPTDFVHLTRRDQHLYGSVDGAIDVVTSTGDEYDSEAVTISTIQIVEEP